MIPLTTLEAAARVAAHAAGRAARLTTGPAAQPPGEDRASPFEAVETNGAPAPMRGPVRGNEQSADGDAGMLLRTG